MAVRRNLIGKLALATMVAFFAYGWFVVGGKGGYVERDGQLTGPEELERRQGLTPKEAST